MQAPTCYNTASLYTVDSSNVGFKLLKKAGWKEGTGLGVNEQGPKVPIRLQVQKDHKGIGFRDNRSDPTAEAAVGRKGQQQNKPAKRNRVNDIVAAELQAEGLDAKLKRHQQVIKNEEKVKRDRAIQQYLYRSFNEPDSTSDQNPLRQPNRLTALNPLLD